MKPPLFTVILVHFQGCTSDHLLLRGIDCILNQTYIKSHPEDVEFLLYHNGPLLDESIVEPMNQRGVKFTCLEKNFDDWGYESRTRAMMAATGEYILNFNSDNELAPEALDEIAAVLMNDINIVIFPIWRNWHGRSMLSGIPPLPCRVDALQAVIRRRIWVDNGGWTIRTQTGDGELIQRFTMKHGFYYLPKILGEHH